MAEEDLAPNQLEAYRLEERVRLAEDYLELNLRVVLYLELPSPQEHLSLLLQELYLLRHPSLLRSTHQHLVVVVFSEAKRLNQLLPLRLKNHQLYLPEMPHKSQLVDKHSLEELV